MTGKDETNREAESRRILDRISREAESGGKSMTGRMADRVRGHVGARDVDRVDWAEYWGTRIGRVLSLIMMVGLIVWLLTFVLG